jgi:hypothetical protein
MHLSLPSIQSEKKSELVLFLFLFLFHPKPFWRLPSGFFKFPFDRFNVGLPMLLQKSMLLECVQWCGVGNHSVNVLTVAQDPTCDTF